MSKYINADQLKAEIERLRDEYTDIAIDSHYGTINANHVVDDLEQLLSFLDTLPEQEPENFNAAFDKYMKEHWTHGTQIKEVARHFAEWGAEHLKK